MSIINIQNTDKFEVVFSNIPVPKGESDVDMRWFNNFVRVVTLPDYSIELLTSDFMNSSYKTPISRANNDLAPLTIEFNADEDLFNYIAFFKWLKTLRCGGEIKGASSSRGAFINAITIVMNDNQNRATTRINLTDVYLVSISSLNLVFGESEQTIFTVTFQMTDWDIEKVDTIRNN